MEMYLASFDVGKGEESFRFSQVVVAKDEADALQMVIEEVKQREFQIGQTNFNYTNSSVTMIDHELLEEAAELVLGWKRR